LRIAVSRVTTAIDGLRMAPQSPNRKPESYSLLSLRTKNFYAKAIKQLTAWMVREKRLEHDPLLYVPLWTVETDIRHDRRALTDNETGAWESGSGESPDVVMALARHRSLQMTMRYTHVDRSARVRAIKSMRSPRRENGQK
jgi:hypothetical protein